MVATRMEFGIQTAPQHVAYDEILAVWQTVEREGFDNAWTFDHFIPIFSNPEGPCLEGWTTLTALLATVPRLRGGTLVTGNSYRHPALLANIAATLDMIPGGAVDMGIGAGRWEMEYRAYGFEFPSVASRIRALEESVDHEGPLDREARELLRPPLHHHRRPLRTEARAEAAYPHLDRRRGASAHTPRCRSTCPGLEHVPHPARGLPAPAGRAREALRGDQRDPATIRKSLAASLVIDTDPGKLQAKLDTVARQRNTTVDAIRSRTLVGTPDDIAGQLVRLAEQGVDHVILSIRAPYPHDDLALFGREVIPRVRKAGL